MLIESSLDVLVIMNDRHRADARIERLRACALFGIAMPFPVCLCLVAVVMSSSAVDE